MNEINDATCRICGAAEVYRRPERLRDSNSIGVLGCHACDHAFLDSFDHIDDVYFERGQFLLNKDYLDGIDDRLRHYEHENEERLERIGPLLVNKRVLDFGCGAGAFMEKIQPLARSVEGLEPTEPFREHVRAKGFAAYATIEETEGEYDFISMFHVLEHLPDPVAALHELSAKLTPGGLMYVEVPNVNDALLRLYDIEASRRFLFYKDHLHYFSRQSLTLAIKRSGLHVGAISGHNRFGLANHLYWLRHGKPGGHKTWSFLETPSLAREYARALAALDMSDSLVAQIRRPE